MKYILTIPHHHRLHFLTCPLKVDGHGDHPLGLSAHLPLPFPSFIFAFCPFFRLESFKVLLNLLCPNKCRGFPFSCFSKSPNHFPNFGSLPFLFRWPVSLLIACKACLTSMVSKLFTFASLLDTSCSSTSKLSTTSFSLSCAMVVHCLSISFCPTLLHELFGRPSFPILLPASLKATTCPTSFFSSLISRPLLVTDGLLYRVRDAAVLLRLLSSREPSKCVRNVFLFPCPPAKFASRSLVIQFLSHKHSSSSPSSNFSLHSSRIR